MYSKDIKSSFDFDLVIEYFQTKGLDYYSELKN